MFENTNLKQFAIDCSMFTLDSCPNQIKPN